MRTFGISRVWLLLCTVLIPSVSFAQEPTATYIEYRFLSPRIKTDSFEASVRKLWRSGERYLRLEEAPDPAQGIWGVLIVNEPDTWMWNKANSSARHLVDKGPTFRVRDAIFQGDAPPLLQKLEFGNEIEFFQQNGTELPKEETLDGIECKAWALSVGDATVKLLVAKATNVPFQIAVSRPSESYAVRYEKYEQVPFDPALFSAPSGAHITDSP